MDDTVIRVTNVHKSFKLYYDKGRSLKEKLLFTNRNHHEVRSVLNGVAFEVKRGEAVGLIGQNGCGKSTILKLLTKIIYPDQGSIEMHGRISSLIELGAGFHPDMTGKENIYTNASIFGLTRKEIDRRFQDIIDFSELGEFIDNPVRTYSSGMYMRLAFAVAINVDADILLIDEILAVGDASFQAKCFNKLREIRAKGTTIVIVSHSMGQIEQFCDRSIWICDGLIRAQGSPRDVHPQYMEYMGKQSGESTPTAEQTAVSEGAATAHTVAEVPPEPGKDRWGSGAARVTEVRLLDQDRHEAASFSTGAPMEILIEYEVKKPLENPACGIGIFRNDDVQCYGTNTQIDHLQGLALGERGTVRCQIMKNQLLPGEYTLDVALHTETGFAYDYYRFAKRFRMYSDVQDAGIMRLEHQWQVEADGRRTV